MEEEEEPVAMNVLVMQEASTAEAEREIRSAWAKYQVVEKYGLEFGKVCYEWREKFKAQGFRGYAKGEGIYAMLHKCEIPVRTAYYWINRYEESIGERHPLGMARHEGSIDELPFRWEDQWCNASHSSSWIF